MTRLTARVVPNASKNEVAGFENGCWKIRLAASPVNGKANETLIRFLSDILDLAPSEIELVRGHGSKMKILDIPLARNDIESALSGSK